MALAKTIKLKDFLLEVQTLQGKVPSSWLVRLRGVAEKVEHPQMDLCYGLDERHIPFIKGHITAQLEVTCDRCLQPMVLDVVAETCLSPELPGKEIPKAYEPVEVHDEGIYLPDLVADELILNIPDYPKHSHEDCANIRELV